MAFDLEAIRSQFPALSDTDHGTPRIYFDNPAGTQVPARVADAMSDCLLKANANIGGYFRTSELAGGIADEAMDAMADFLNAPSPEEIIFGQNMTSLTFHVSRSIGKHLQAGDEIIVTRMDHDANVHPWVLMARDYDLDIKWLPFDVESFEFDLSKLEDLITDRTRLICVGGASNLTGTINDVAGISRMARDAGAWTYIDAVQSAPHVITDVQAIGCDFLVCSPYKFFGPHQGVMWGHRNVLELLEPYKVRPAPASIPWNFAPGTASHEGMAGTTAAVDYFGWVGSEFAGSNGDRKQRIHDGLAILQEYELELSTQLIEGLQSLDGIKVHGITSSEGMCRRVPTVSFTHVNVEPDTIAQFMADANIFVWSGHNYAVEVADSLGLLESGGVVRVGPVHYNDKAEIDRFLEVLDQILH